MEYHAREIKAGLLVIVSFLAFLAFIFTITGIDWERTENHFTARFKFIGGIDHGSMVRFGGFLVGTVTDMHIASEDNTQIEVELTVDARTPVREDSEAFITSLNLMGEYYIEITTGSKAKPLLASGSRLRSRDVPPLSQLSEPFLDVSEQLAILLIRLNDLLNEENRQRLSHIVANADTLLDTNADQISDIVENLNSLTFQLQSISGKLDKLMGDNAQTLESALSHLDLTLSRADTLLTSVHETTRLLDNMVIANQTGFYEAMQSFEAASQNFEQFSRTIKERPWTLVRKSAPPERKIP